MLYRDVADGVHRVGEHFVNWYLIEESGQLTVVDAGLPASWRSLLEALKAIGRAPGDVEALVLTHAHFDHIGFAERARVELGIPVWVHENDSSLTRRPWLYMSERSPFSYLGPKTLPIVSSFIRAGAPRVGPIREVRRFGDEGSLDVPGSPRCPVHTGPHPGPRRAPPARARRGHLGRRASHARPLHRHSGPPDRREGSDGRQ